MNNIFGSIKMFFNQKKNALLSAFNIGEIDPSKLMEQLPSDITAPLKENANIPGKISQKISHFKSNLLSFKKPKELNEYYHVGSFLLAKKIGNILLCITLLGGIWCLIAIGIPKIKLSKKVIGSGVKECYYTSPKLKKYTGQVRIFAKKNDALYEGAISNGVASGLGTLYDKNGNLLYRGAFANNTFHGDGTLYFSNGQVKYNGKFSKNIFNGNGALSFPSGRVEYIGAFLNGKKHGKGSLFTETGAKIYEGMFYNDNPDLSAYLNVDVVSLKDVFLGSKVIYNCENKMCISYPDLNCMIVADRDENTLGKTQKIFIIPPNYYPGTNSESNRFNLMAILDDNFVNGFTKLTPTEMCVIDVMRKHGSNRFKNYDFISKEEALKDVFDVTTQSSDYEIYVSKYKIHSFVYTFYFEASDTPYAFYSIERVG